MSTTKAPKKDKPISDNWEILKGGRNEQPDSFDFTDEKKLRIKKQQGYEGHWLFLDEKVLLYKRREKIISAS